MSRPNVLHADRGPAPCPPLRKQPDAEPIPGYRLIEPIGSGGFGEVWKCVAPGGLLKAIKFVYGGQSALDEGNAPAEEEFRAIQRVKDIRHPFILSMERVESQGGELIIVLELADKSLHDLLAEYRRAGQVGIPRDELLGYLRETAEALDLMNLQYGLQHLDIKPRNLFLVSNHVKVGDFGLVNSLGWGESGAASPQLGGITPLYASPEVFRGTISRASDQYSLALVYHELLTGKLLFNGKNARQLLLQHTAAEPDLGRLPAVDRPAVARALAKDARERFPSCADFVRGLLAASGGPGDPGPRLPPAAERETTTPNPGRDSKETVVIATGNTETLASRPSTPAGGESLAGHRLLSCLLCTPLTEVWKAEAADGSRRLVKLIFGFAHRESRQEEDAVTRFQALKHPALAPVEILQCTPGRLALATDPSEKTLRDRLQECVSQGLPGIPRPELLGYLRAVAEALDQLYREQGVLHLGLNARNLFLQAGRVLIADFGLVHLLWLPAGQPVTKLNARYSAPELFRKEPHPGCDQYSLALIYHEMLTGSQAQGGAARSNETDGRQGGGYNLERLPEADREIIDCALDPAPHRRWPSCAEMVAALEAAGKVRETGRQGDTESKSVHPSIKPSIPGEAVSPASDVLQTQLSVHLPLGLIRLRLEAFRQQWKGEAVRKNDMDYVFQMKTPRSVWQRWLGRAPGLEVHFRLSCTSAASPADMEVAVEIKPRDCGRKQSDELLKVIGPLLLESARTYLQVNPRRRAHERFVWRYPLQLCPIHPDGTAGEPIECEGKDISLNGIGFYVPCELPTADARLCLPQTPQTPSMTVPVRVVRLRSCEDGWYEAGAVLLPPEPGNGKDRAR